MSEGKSGRRMFLDSDSKSPGIWKKEREVNQSERKGEEDDNNNKKTRKGNKKIPSLDRSHEELETSYPDTDFLSFCFLIHFALRNSIEQGDEHALS
jgi:hypothetical protein